MKKLQSLGLETCAAAVLFCNNEGHHVNNCCGGC